MSTIIYIYIYIYIIHVCEETLPDGKLGLGLDDADEDQRGVLIVQINKRTIVYDSIVWYGMV